MKAFLAAILLITVIAHGADNPLEASPLKLELAASPLTVTFTNTGKVPIRILKPLDGSEWGWIMPHYQLVVTDERAEAMPLRARCGFFGYPFSDTKWPDDYLVTIQPGSTYKHFLQSFHDIKTAGLYSLRFQYVFKPKTDQTPGGPYPSGLWRGVAASNTIKMKLGPLP